MTSLTIGEMVAAARGRVEELSAAQVAQELADPGVLLVNLREPEERQTSGAIPGAIHVPRGMLEFHADPTNAYHMPELTPKKRVILHCASGGRSALAADVLRQLGYTRIAHLAGGLNEWVEAGQPVAAPESGSR